MSARFILKAVNEAVSLPDKALLIARVVVVRIHSMVLKESSAVGTALCRP
jgi:hypothetical protein